MRHKRPSPQRPSAIEQVQEIENIRREKNELYRAFSEEQERNLRLSDQHKCLDQRVLSMEHQIIDLKSELVKSQDNERVTRKEVEMLRERNDALQRENEHMRQQIRAQDDAIVGA